MSPLEGYPRLLNSFGPLSSSLAANEGVVGPSSVVTADMEAKQQAMERISSRLFVSDAREPDFEAAQHWIEACSRQVSLPINFCGGLLIMRLCRVLATPVEKSHQWMASVCEAAAAYDFAFLALAHADDEADRTLVRDGLPTRFVTHSDTRAVDAVNLLLAGITAMQETLRAWRQSACDDETPATGHPLGREIMEEFLRALREASFPIILDRAGFGHSAVNVLGHEGKNRLQIDAESLGRVEAFNRHRAHTYFMRATALATLISGYKGIEPRLLIVLNDVFHHFGSIGAGADDLEDIHLDFEAGIHSICTVMAHLCVSEDLMLRPAFRRDLPADQLSDQRARLAFIFGAAADKTARHVLLALLDEIELRKALSLHFANQGAFFADAMYKAVVDFGFSVELMSELVAIVCRDPEFSFPEVYAAAMKSVNDQTALSFVNAQVGSFIAEYVLTRFWPKIGA